MSILKAKTYTIEGAAPLLMHSGAMADTMNPATIELKKITGKRTKTEDDHIEMARLEWYAGLLLDKEGKLCIPGEYIEAVLLGAAKKSRSGPQCKAGLFCDAGGKLIHDGPADLEKMWKSGKFTDRRGVVVQRARIMRTRPRFDNWKVTFEINYNSSILNESKIDEFVETGGIEIGIGDYRPKFGRYNVL
jgi:hypothetical protein